MRRRLLLPVLALASSLALLASSCLSPTLPLPPPEQPDTINAGTTPGTWDVFGQCTPGALVTVFNEKTGKGVVVEDRSATGHYVVTLEGTQCDVAYVKEEISGDESAPTSFVLAPHKPGDPSDNPLCH
jgi:hypothetical protein